MLPQFLSIVCRVLALGALSIQTALAQVAETAEPAATLSDTDALVQELLAESQQHKKARKLDPADPLTQAEEFSMRLGEDIGELAERRRGIMLGYAKRGRWEDALQLSREVPGWQAALAPAELALAAARAGKSDLAREQLAISRQSIIYCAGTQKDRVRLAWARVCHALKDDAALAEVTPSLAPDTLLQFLTETRTLEPGPFPTEPMIQDRMTQQKIPPAVVAPWVLMLAEIHHSATRKQEARELVDLAGRICAPPAPYADQRALTNVAMTASRLGLEDLSDRAATIYTASVLRLSDGVDDKAELLSDAAIMHSQLGRKNEAAKLLKHAAQAAAKTFIYFAVDAHLAVARGWHRVGDAAKAHESVLAAARVAAGTDHKIARASAAARICLFHDEEGLAIQPDVAAFLTEVRSSP